MKTVSENYETQTKNLDVPVSKNVLKIDLPMKDKVGY
jgi:hypothetical protein